MATSQTPLRALKAQSDLFAKMLKQFERGEKVDDVRFAEKLQAARLQEGIKFGIVMDDKTLIIEMPWTMVKDFSEVALSEYMLKAMRGIRNDS